MHSWDMNAGLTMNRIVLVRAVHVLRMRWVADHAQGEVVQSAVGVVVTEPTALPVLSKTAASRVCTRLLVYNLDELETDCS